MDMSFQRNELLSYMQRDKTKDKMGYPESEESNMLVVRDVFMTILIVIFDEVTIAYEDEIEVWFGFGYEGRVEGFPSGSRLVMAATSKRVGVTIPQRR